MVVIDLADRPRNISHDFLDGVIRPDELLRLVVFDFAVFVGTAVRPPIWI